MEGTTTMWATLCQELMEHERGERLAAIEKLYKNREALRVAGYRSTGDRLRSRTAGWLLRLATLLDNRIVDGAPSTLRHA